MKRSTKCSIGSFVILFVLILPRVDADDLTVSGIMRGARPTAIVNDQVVTPGNRIEGYSVVEIGADYVVFADETGGRITRHLKKEKKTKAAKPPVAAAASASPQVSDAQPVISDKAGKHLDKSMTALRQADALLKSEIKYDEMYVRAIARCDEAMLEAQTALKTISDEHARRSLNDHMAKIRQARAAIIRQKDELNTRVRTAVANRQIFVGMTAQNVISSWGVPLSKTTVRNVERWAYKDNNGHQRNLSFSDGVLVGF